jgi:hypothetical protein
MIALTPPLPAVVRPQQTVILRGHVRGTRGARIELEVSRLRVDHGPVPPWKVLARSTPRRGGGFVLRWRVPLHLRPGQFALRVVAERKGRIVDESSIARMFVGPAKVPCAAPTPPSNLPAGDGWVTGGNYIEGGPFPGIYECRSQAYTVTATNRAGQAVATQHVAGGQSYTLVLPAGSYTLNTNTCASGSATVTAGQQTKADAVCRAP